MQHKNLLSQQIQLNFTFYVYKETKYRVFSKASSHLGLQLGWTMSPSGKGNCTAVARGQSALAIASQSFGEHNTTEAHCKFFFWRNLHWLTSSLSLKRYCDSWHSKPLRYIGVAGIIDVKAWIWFFPLVCGGWSGKEERSLTRSNMRDRIQCCERGEPCSYNYLWIFASGSQLFVWLRQDIISTGPWMTYVTGLSYQVAVSSWCW